MSESTKNVISRRGLVKGGAVLGAAVAGAAALSDAGVKSAYAADAKSASASSSVDAKAASASKAADEGDAAISAAPDSYVTTDITAPAYDYSAIKSKTEAAATGHYDFKYVNQPIELGGFTLKNRIVKSASSGFESSGTFDMQVDNYKRLVAGGVAMIVYPVKEVQATDDDAAQFSPLAEAMHEEGVPLFAQILSESEDRSSTYDLHAPLGRPLACKEMADAFGMTLKDMTNFIQPGTFTMLSTEDLQAKLEGLAQSALHLKNAGFDGIEINAAAEHFFDSFLSRFWNRERDDQYGPQSLENRARVVTELIERIHELCGEDFPVGVLFNGCEVNGIYPGDEALCTKVDEACEFAKIFEAAGASHLQIRSVVFGNHSAGFFPDLMFTNNLPDNTYGHFFDIKRWWPEFVADYGGAGAFIDTAAKIKSVVDIPVMVVGMEDLRLLPDVLDEAIGAGKIDLVAGTRRFIADFDYPNKVLSGDLASIRPCNNCTQCLQGTCRVNPAYGRGEKDEMPEGFDIVPADVAKRVLVAGGGPAGLEAARVAAVRGHSVTLCEKTGTWGGLALQAIAVKGKHEKIQDYLDWLVRECERLGVDMRLNTEVTADFVAQEAPDALIQATGGVKTVPDVPGLQDSKQLAAGFAGGDNVVVMGGMECEGTEMASYLADMGKKVTLIDEISEDDFGILMSTWAGHTQHYYCQTHGVQIMGGITVESVDDEGVTVTLDHDGIQRKVACDGIVLSYPPTTDSSLADAVVAAGKVAEVYTVGDCNARGLIRDAVRDANLTARHM